MPMLYFDCFSGISGDMTIGALLDLGVELGYLQTELQKLPVTGYHIEASRVVRANISAMKFDVRLDKESKPPLEEHSHPHGAHHSSGFHCKAADILSMIRTSGLNANTKRMADAIFTKLAISEGRVHRIPPEEVEFHEIGAVDSIVDTVGTAIGLDALGIDRFVCSSINVGGGFIHCQHGVYPVPAPATADLLRGASIYSRHVSTELVTPTGAAILAALVDEFRTLNEFSIDRVGYGAGTKQFQDFPNCLRLMMGSEKNGSGSNASTDLEDFHQIMVLEANIDDMAPQNFAYVTERLLESGALDVSTIPIQMKKGRPGCMLQVLSPINRAEILSRIIFEETTTIGLRQYPAKRIALERELISVETRFGAVMMKVSRRNGTVVSCSPEYEDCARIARERNVPLKEIQALAMEAFRMRES